MRSSVLFVAAILLAAGCSSTTTVVQGGPGGGGPAASDQPAPIPPEEDLGENGRSLANGIDITEIAVYQAVKVDIVKDAKRVAKRNAGLAAGRDALVRVFVKPGDGFEAKELRAELRVFAEGQDKPAYFKDAKTLTKASTDADLASTFNFEVPGDKLTQGATYSVVLIDERAPKTKATDLGSQYPLDGTAESLELTSTGKLKVQFVPVKYNYDQSGRLPDTTQAQLDRYKEVLYVLYPASEVELTLHAPYAWSQRIAPNGGGWSSLLQSIMRLRDSENAADDMYYYATFAPTASLGSFCQGGCVMGLSTVAETPNDSWARASIGVGFAGFETAFTMAHEVGHAHGREHSPCGGAASPDPYYPYSNAGLGSWGYDIVSKELIAPTKATDIMGYCNPQWISDYTYNKFFERMRSLAASTRQSTMGALPNAPQAYRLVDVAEDGTLTWGDSVPVRTRLGGELRTARFLTEAGQQLGTADARYYKYDHLPGGFLLVPDGAPATATRVAVEGFDKPLLRTIAR
jgi:hypothetical protein